MPQPESVQELVRAFLKYASIWKGEGDINRVVLEGSLVSDPELRYNPRGQAVGDFRISVGKARQRRKGDPPRDALADYPKHRGAVFHVTAYDRVAETAAEYLKRGSRVLVLGWLIQEYWETISGRLESYIKVVAETIKLLPIGKGETRRSDVPHAGDMLFVKDALRPVLALFKERLEGGTSAEAAEMLSAAVEPLVRLYNRHRRSLSPEQAALWPAASTGIETQRVKKATSGLEHLDAAP